MDGIQALRDLKGIEVVLHSDDNYGTKNRYRWISVSYSLGGRQAYTFVYLGKDMLETYPGSLKSKYTTFGSHLIKTGEFSKLSNCFPVIVRFLL